MVYNYLNERIMHTYISMNEHMNYSYERIDLL